MQINYNELLIRSLDEPLSSREQKLLETELERNLELRQIKDDLHNIRNSLANYRANFDDEFVTQVLNRLSIGGLYFSPHYFQRIVKWTGLAAAAVILFLLMLVYWDHQTLDLDSLLGLADLRPEDFDHYFANY